MTDKGTCEKHGEFVLTEGCRGCAADRVFYRRNSGITPQQDEMEAGLNQEGLTLSEAARAAGAEITEVTMEAQPEKEEGPESQSESPSPTKSVESSKPKYTTTALLNVKPQADTSVIDLFTEANKLLHYAELRVIATVEDIKSATDDLSIISKLKKALEEKRKGYLKPLAEHQQAIRTAFDTLMEPILGADRITRAKILDFQKEEERIRQEQEEINRMRLEAAQKEAALNGGVITESVGLVEVSPEVPKRTQTDMGTTGTATIWKFEVVDFSLLPDRFKMENATLIGKVVRAGEREIPGVKIWSENTLKVRAR